MLFGTNRTEEEPPPPRRHRHTATATPPPPPPPFKTALFRKNHPDDATEGVFSTGDGAARPSSPASSKSTPATPPCKTAIFKSSVPAAATAAFLKPRASPRRALLRNHQNSLEKRDVSEKLKFHEIGIVNIAGVL